MLTRPLTVFPFSDPPLLDLFSTCFLLFLSVLIDAPWSMLCGQVLSDLRWAGVALGWTMGFITVCLF